MADFRNLSPLPKIPKLSLGGKSVTFFVGVLVVVLIIIDGLVSVPPGHVGIIYDRGRGVLADELPAGLHLKIPFWQVSYLTDVRTQEYTMSIAPGEGAVYHDDSMTAPTSDGQTVKVDATVLFHVDHGKAAELFATVGPDYIQKIVRPIARSQIRAQMAEYTAIDAYALKRDEAETKINERIQALYAEKDIVLERVLLRQIAFSPEYASAIEDKQVAEQRIQKAEYQRLEAEKLKEKVIIEAQADAEAIRLKGETLRANPQVIQFEFVQKMSPNITWGIMPDNILPLLNLGL
ncbi:MAG: prohibitin family protein [Candidatus Peregrinibacteria bacterium]|nr:prohibitin family protein [Candidatus Peregrinibacteria bacterium]